MDPRRRWLLLGAIAVVVAAIGVFIVAGGDGDGPDLAVDSVRTGSTSSTSVPPAGESTTTSTVDPAAPPTTAALASREAAAPSTTRREAAAPTVPGPAPTTVQPECRRPAAGSDFAGFGAAEIVITNESGTHRSCVLTADTPSQQQQGLMHQDDLDTYDGMIFRFQSEEERYFWMRNTRIPLSIAFYNAAGSFVSATDMPPCGDSPECPNYASHGAAKYALEVLRGQLPSAGATSGSRLAT